MDCYSPKALKKIFRPNQNPSLWSRHGAVCLGRMLILPAIHPLRTRDNGFIPGCDRKITVLKYKMLVFFRRNCFDSRMSVKNTMHAIPRQPSTAHASGGMVESGRSGGRSPLGFVRFSGRASGFLAGIWHRRHPTRALLPHAGTSLRCTVQPLHLAGTTPRPTTGRPKGGDGDKVSTFSEPPAFPASLLPYHTHLSPS